MSLSQFLLPGEIVRFEAPGEVYFRRRPYAAYVTGERLLLHAAGARRGGAERAVAEPLASIVFAEYTEGGRLRKSVRLDVHSAHHTLTLKGEPAVVVSLWRALQEHALRPAAADEEATLVAPPPPLFEDQPGPPAQVQPLASAPRPRQIRPARKVWTRAALVAFVCAAALVALAGAVMLGRRAAPPDVAQAPPAPAPPVSATPTPLPTPVTLRVMDELFSLEGGTHHAVPFTVPGGPGAARVSGGFRVTGDGQVDFYVMNREQYEGFSRAGGPEVRSVLYREGQRNARVGEQLPPGDYYLVFDNYHTGDGPRTVAAEFFLLLDAEAAAAR